MPLVFEDLLGGTLMGWGTYNENLGTIAFLFLVIVNYDEALSAYRVWKLKPLNIKE